MAFNYQFAVLDPTGRLHQISLEQLKMALATIPDFQRLADIPDQPGKAALLQKFGPDYLVGQLPADASPSETAARSNPDAPTEYMGRTYYAIDEEGEPIRADE